MPKHNPTAQRVVPIVGWPGGKSRLLRHLLPLIERCPHKTYVEPFAGGAAVLLAKRPAHLEVLNDLNGELINVYRCARHHTRELLRLVRALPSGRAVFREVKESRPETDLLRAARFFYLLKCSTFGQAHSWLNKPLPRRGLGKRLAAFRRRMECVILECRPAEELLPIYDTPQTLFFLDPPYVSEPATSTVTTTTRPSDSRPWPNRCAASRAASSSRLTTVPSIASSSRVTPSSP